MALQIVTWWLVIAMIGVLALPLTTVLFQALPDRGYAFSKALGLLLMGYGAWLLAMLGLGSFGVVLLLLVLLLVAAVGIGMLGSGSTEPQQHRLARLWGVVAGQWGSVLFYEVLFLVALVAMAWLRSHMPDPWGTERPMDYAFFNAIQRSGSFPPHDPWLAGYSINYYYFGYLLMAAVAMLSGLDPAVGFTMSLALIFALTALGIAGVLNNLLRLTQPDQGAAPGRWPVLVLGVVLVLLAANQSGALQVITGDHRVVALDGQQMAAALGQSLGGDDDEQIRLPSPVHTDDFGTFAVLERGDRVEDFNWWWPSRALWDEYKRDAPAASEPPVIRRYNITEFPFFSFWLGDMHPHVMALPFNLLALALALHLVAVREVPFAVWRAGAGRREWLLLLLTGIVLGSLYTINSWDLPTALLLFLGALLLLHVQMARQTGNTLAWGRMVRQALVVLLAAFLPFLPFSLTFHSLVGFAEPLIDVPLLDRLTRTIAPYSASRSGLHHFVVIFGLFALPLVAFVYTHLQGTTQGTTQRERLLLVLLAPLLLAVGVVVNFPYLALAGLGIVAAYQAVRCAHAPAESFVLLVVALGCAILFGTELIYIRDVFSNRMNTIFKFYYQVWLLWGTVAPYALWWLLRAALPASSALAVRLTGVLVAVGFVVLLAGALVYPTINVQNLLEHEQEITLAGKTPRETTEGGQAAIAWLRENAERGSVLLEGVGGSYSPEGYGGISASTGIPTVLGWPGHERQWRGGDAAAKAEIAPREADVERIYATPDAAQALGLLRQYGVDYVYVGALERQRYGGSLQKFHEIGAVVFQQDEVTIYRIPDDTQP